METLPVEILSEIFSYLSVREFLTISEVSRTFYSVVNSKVFLKNVWANFSYFDDFKKSKRNYANIKIEHIREEQMKKGNTILSRRNHIPIVQRLKIDDIEITSAETLCNWIMNFESIVELHLEGINLKTSTTNICIKLSHLKILKFFYSTNNLLQLFSEITNQLEILKLCLIPHENEASKVYTYAQVEKILQNNRLSLKKLNFYEVNFDDQFLNQISSIKLLLLKKFSISFNSCLSQESIGFRKFVKQHSETLEKFKIRTFDHISEHHLKVLIENAVNIQSLNLIICSSCNFEIFFEFENLQRLEKLKIQPTNYCSSSNFNYLRFLEERILHYRNLNLKHLTLEMIPNSISIIKKITSSFPNLITLNLSSSFTIENHVNLLKENLKYLKKVIINCEDFSYKFNNV